MKNTFSDFLKSIPPHFFSEYEIIEVYLSSICKHYDFVALVLTGPKGCVYYPLDLKKVSHISLETIEFEDGHKYCFKTKTHVNAPSGHDKYVGENLNKVTKSFDQYLYEKAMSQNINNKLTTELKNLIGEQKDNQPAYLGKIAQKTQIKFKRQNKSIPKLDYSDMRVVLIIGIISFLLGVLLVFFKIGQILFYT